MTYALAPSHRTGNPCGLLQLLLSALVKAWVELASLFALIVCFVDVARSGECHAEPDNAGKADQSRDNQEIETAAAHSQTNRADFQRPRIASAMRRPASQQSVHPTDRTPTAVMLGLVPRIPVGPSMGTPAHPRAARTEILGTSPRMTAREAKPAAQNADHPRRKLGLTAS